MTDEKEVITPEDAVEVADETEHDAPDSEDGDSDDVAEDGESGEVSTKAKKDDDVDVDFYRKRLEESEARNRELANVTAERVSREQRERYEENERQKLLLMSPEEKLEYKAAQQTSYIEHMVKQSEARILQAQDKAEFAVFCARNNVPDKLAIAVEKRYEEAIRNGHTNVSRKDVAIRELGEKAYASLSKGGSKKQKKEASENITRSKSSATKGVGDKKLNGKLDPNSREARNERLRNMSANR